MGRPASGRRARKPARQVPVPPELVTLLRGHLERYGTGRTGAYSAASGNPLQPSTWWRVWQKARAFGLTPVQQPRRCCSGPTSAPFRRHLAAQLRRAPTEVGAWAGHSVEVLMRVYAKCMTGLEDVWIGRMNDALHLEDPQRNDGRRSARQDGEDPE